MEKHLTAASLSYPLDRQGIAARGQMFANLGTSPLVEHAVRNGEGLLAKDGPFVVATGKHTGRSAKDKFIVRDATTESTVWWGKTNVGMTPEHFAALKEDFFGRRGQGNALCRGPVRRLAARAPRQRARDQRVRLAQPVHPHPAGAPHQR
jgi:phosphoenolpyruvate carboxykinase (ATP)